MQRTKPVLKKDVKPPELFDYTIFLLSRQDYTEKKLRQKLSERYPHQSDWHDQTIERLIDMGYINDRGFAENFTRSLLNQSLGKQKIREKMYHKGFPAHLIDEIINSDMVNNSDFHSGALAWRKKWAGDRKITDQKEYRRLLGRLLRKGFSYSEAKEALAFSGE